MKPHTLKYAVGAILSRAFPKKTESIRRSFTLPHLDNRVGSGRTSRLIRYYLGQTALLDPAHLESLHREFWIRQKADGWYAKTAERFRNLSLPLLSELVPRCLPAIQQKKITRVCEFGCGDGQWLNFLFEQWTGPNEFLGLDLSEEQIRSNQERYPNLKFECADLTQWVHENSSPNTIFLTCCGVLEYLSKESLSKVFRDIASRSPNSLLLLIEPVEKEFDLSQKPESIPCGHELSYSHNYPKLLEDEGISIDFEVEFQEMPAWPGYRMLAILAKTP